MKERILSRWTMMRVLYVVAGIFVVIQSIIEKQWMGVVFGGYFASMGIFAFGCAAGNCFGGSCAPEPKQKSSAAIRDVEFEEIKATQP